MPNSRWLLFYLGIAFELTGSILKAIHIVHVEPLEIIRKVELLYEFHLFEQRGYPMSRFSIGSDISEMEFEYHCLKRKENQDNLKREQEQVIKLWEIFCTHQNISLEIIK